MKLSLATLSLVITGVVGAVMEGPAPVIARHLAKNHEFFLHDQRELALDCPQIVPIFEDILTDLYGVGFDCSCGGLTISCSSRGETCCGDTCMTITDTATFNNNDMPVSERVCATFTGDSVFGEPMLADSTRCVDVDYCGTTSVCGCVASLDNTQCNSCTPCNDLPFLASGVEFMTMDCSNVPGGSAISFQCEDFDTMEEVEEFGFTNCHGSGATLAALWHMAGVASLVGLWVLV